MGRLQNACATVERNRFCLAVVTTSRIRTSQPLKYNTIYTSTYYLRKTITDIQEMQAYLKEKGAKLNKYITNFIWVNLFRYILDY